MNTNQLLYNKSLNVWSSTGHVPPLRTASITPGFRTPTWCASGGRLSPLRPPVSRNSWPTSSIGDRRWPPGTRFFCGPTRARHKPPPAPPRQLCQRHPSHLSPSENRLPNTRWRDFKARLWAARWGGPFRFQSLNFGQTRSGCDLQRFLFLFWLQKGTLSNKSLFAFFYTVDLVHARQDVVLKLVPQGL